MRGGAQKIDHHHGGASDPAKQTITNPEKVWITVNDCLFVCMFVVVLVHSDSDSFICLWNVVSTV